VRAFARRPTLLALALASVSPALAFGGSVDPTAPRTIVVGEPMGAASMQRIDGARSNRSRTLIPLDPIVKSRSRLLGDVTTVPSVDEHGRLVVATSDGVLSQLDAQEHVEWTAALGSDARTGPVIASDGTRIVVTERGEALGFTDTGERTFVVPLDGERGPLRAAPLCASDGSIVFAVGSRVLRVGPGGAVLSSATTEDPIVALVERGRTTFLVTDSGAVLAWKPPAAPRELGSFGGRPTTDVVASGSTTLIAVLHDSTLIALDARDGRRRTLATLGPQDAFTSAPTVLRSGELRFVTRAGWLVGHDGEHETVRVSIAPSMAASAGPSTMPALPLLADDGGAVAFVAAAATVVVAAASNDVRSASVEGCGTPVALLPRGPKSLLLVCRSGLVAVLGQR
jgi:hypothetical protein